MADYINVTSLNRLAKRVLEQCDPLNDLIVCGEISGFTRHYKSGHLYFTLKDENASIKTVMFRSQAQLLNFEPQNGMLVLVYGRATIYERDGAFQLYADYMKPFGAGAAQMAFDALYKKLEAEGLFAPERKRPLPAVPRCIGVVTSKTGAAWQDVQNVIGRRWPMVKLLLAPVSVQGIEAEKSIVDGIRRLDRDPRPDLILVTRGGGSKEDLWVFNSERIARAAAAGADYIGLGPFRFTQTKSNLSPILGLEGYRSLLTQCRRAGITLPVVAIGGITAADIADLCATGIGGIALSGALLTADDPVGETRTILELIDKNQH